MSRDTVRSIKKAMRDAHRHTAPQEAELLSRDCAVALLARSIRFGHGRLAVIRLCAAAQVGAEISGEQWAYCARASVLSSDFKLQELFRRAASLAAGPRLDSRPEARQPL